METHFNKIGKSLVINEVVLNKTDPGTAFPYLSSSILLSIVRAKCAYVAGPQPSGPGGPGALLTDECAGGGSGPVAERDPGKDKPAPAPPKRASPHHLPASGFQPYRPDER